MSLYIKRTDGSLQRVESFMLLNTSIGAYIGNIFYMPDNEFDAVMAEIGQEPTFWKDDKEYDNRGIAIHSSTNKIDAFLRPDSCREKDRQDYNHYKELKSRGIISKEIRKN